MFPLKNKYSFLIIFGIFLLAVISRYQAISWNLFPHGDVFQEVLIARALPKTKLFVLPYKGGVPRRVAHLTDQVVITDKPPLWVFFISIFSEIFKQDTFSVAKYLSFIISILVMGIFYKLNRVFFDKLTTFASLLIFSFSYLMIDFAGNGSRYMLQTFLLLSLIYVLVSKSWRGLKIVITSSSLFALLFLVNYPMITLAPAVFFGLYQKKVLTKKNLLLSFGLIALWWSPWILYNLHNYHLPLWITNLSRIATGLGIYSSSASWENGKVIFDEYLPPKTVFEYLRLIPSYIFPNTIFLLKKMLVILPLLSIFLYLALPLRILTLMKDKKKVIFFLMTLAHVLMFLSWRVLKFRYLVSFYPLFLISGLLAIMNFKKSLRIPILVGTLICTLLISLKIYQKNSYHTYYYDGVFTEDQFREFSEASYMDKLVNYEKLAKKIPKEKVVSTDFVRAYFLDEPAYLINPLSLKEHFQEIIDAYQIEYLWLGNSIDQQDLAMFPEIELIEEQKGEYLYKIGGK